MKMVKRDDEGDLCLCACGPFMIVYVLLLFF